MKYVIEFVLNGEVVEERTLDEREGKELYGLFLNGKHIQREGVWYALVDVSNDIGTTLVRTVAVRYAPWPTTKEREAPGRLYQEGQHLNDTGGVLTALRTENALLRAEVERLTKALEEIRDYEAQSYEYAAVAREIAEQALEEQEGGKEDAT